MLTNGHVPNHYLLSDTDIQPFPLLNNVTTEAENSTTHQPPTEFLSPVQYAQGPSCGYLLALLSKLKGESFIHQDNPFLSALRVDEHLDHAPPAAPALNKYDHPKFINQGALYEAMDKILEEFKSCKDLRWFVHPVKELDAPKYFDYITKPMCLNDMRHKLNAAVYKSRQEFVADLNLIYTNCVKYNGLESWIVTEPGEALRRKTLQAALKIPDLNIYHIDHPPPDAPAPPPPLPSPIPPTIKKPFGNYPVIHWDPTSPVPALPVMQHVQGPTDSPEIPSPSHKSALATLRAWTALRTHSEYITDIQTDNMIRVSPTDAMKPVEDGLDVNWAAFKEQAGCAELKHNQLRRTVCLLLGYIGFTGCQASTLYIVADLWIELVSKLAAAIQICTEFPMGACKLLDPFNLPPRDSVMGIGRECRMESILHLCGFDLIALHDHSVLEVARSAVRMADLERRIQNKVKDLLLGGVSKQLVDDLPQDPFTGGNEFLAELLGEEDLFGNEAPKPAAETLSTLWIQDAKSGYYHKRVDATADTCTADLEIQARLANDPAAQPWPRIQWTADQQAVESGGVRVIGLLASWFKASPAYASQQEGDFREDADGPEYTSREAKAKMNERETRAALALDELKRISGSLARPAAHARSTKRKR